MWSNLSTLEIVFVKVVLIVIRGACDHYLSDLREEFIRQDSFES